MSRGNSSGDLGLKLIFMKIRGLKKGETAHIEQAEALGEGKTKKLDETITKVSGTLHKVETREYEYEGEKVQEVKIWLKDLLAGEMYAISVGLNSIGRSIVNTLLNLVQPYGELELRVYNKKDDGMPAVYIEHNGTKAGWKYTYDELKKYITVNTVTKKGVTKEEKDYFALDQFLLGELTKNVISKFGIPTKFGKQPAEKAPVDNMEPVGDDLPF